MFKELYKEDNGLIAPDAAFIEELTEKMRIARAKPSFFTYKRGVPTPLIAAAVLMITGALALNAIILSGVSVKEASSGGYSDGERSNAAGGDSPGLDEESPSPGDYDVGAGSEDGAAAWSPPVSKADGLDAYIAGIYAFRYFGADYTGNYVVVPENFAEYFANGAEWEEIPADEREMPPAPPYILLHGDDESGVPYLFEDGTLAVCFPRTETPYRLFRGEPSLYAELLDIAGNAHD
ncbi:MAG: hypothetical protein LBI36_01890 [Oscillospiraceae bacterium]|jgi:hypothetical protein|nr:hypothetical protein [Oscillospiraceae bacterium]